MLSRVHDREQDKNPATVFNRVEVQETEKFAIRDAAVKLMKQNEKLDDEFGNKSI
jgi:hypothetical protein